MARKIVITRWLEATAGRDLEATAVFWLDVPAARQPFQAREAGGEAFQSAVLDATPAELAALRTGAVREVVETYRVPNNPTAAQAQTFLQNEHARLQAETAARNPWRFAGSSWDGSTWTIVTVA